MKVAQMNEWLYVRTYTVHWPNIEYSSQLFRSLKKLSKNLVVNCHQSRILIVLSIIICGTMC